MSFSPCRWHQQLMDFTAWSVPRKKKTSCQTGHSWKPPLFEGFQQFQHCEGPFCMEHPALVLPTVRRLTAAAFIDPVLFVPDESRTLLTGRKVLPSDHPSVGACGSQTVSVVCHKNFSLPAAPPLGTVPFKHGIINDQYIFTVFRIIRYNGIPNNPGGQKGCKTDPAIRGHSRSDKPCLCGQGYCVR